VGRGWTRRITRRQRAKKKNRGEPLGEEAEKNRPASLAGFREVFRKKKKAGGDRTRVLQAGASPPLGSFLGFEESQPPVEKRTSKDGGGDLDLPSQTLIRDFF